jgi:hypothetical protein
MLSARGAFNRVAPCCGCARKLDCQLTVFIERDLYEFFSYYESDAQAAIHGSMDAALSKYFEEEIK